MRLKITCLYAQFGKLPFCDLYRVSAWGDDDFGLEMDFTEKHLAKNMFDNILKMKFVNIHELLDLGFVQC